MNNYDFAFIVHSRGIDDLHRKYKFLKYFPNKFVKWLAKSLPPILVSEITGLVTKNRKESKGCIIGVTMTAHQMIEDRKLALSKIKKAVLLAKKKGAKIVGLGGLTASLSRGGKDLLGIEGIGITTGRAYTVKTVTDYVKKIIADFDLDKKKLKIAVVGAAGSIGSGSALVLADYGVNNFLFIDLEKKADKVRRNIQKIRNSDLNLNIKLSHKVSEVRGADIIIAATNAPEVVIISKDVSQGTIIVNDAQPSDVSPEIIKNREDVMVVEGGIVKTPGISSNFNFSLADKYDNYCCLGEVLVLAYNEHYKIFSIGEQEISLIKEIEEMAKGFEISISDYQNDLGYIKKDKISLIKKLIRNKKTQEK